MEKYNRNQRIVAITKEFMENPNKIINLNTFSNRFNAAKSTISEDIFIIKETLSKFNMGKIETISGAAGGVKYLCGVSNKECIKFANNLAGILKDEQRIISGDFLYMTDIMSNPDIVHKAGVIIASFFNELPIDYVITVETKGIPLAYEVAKMLGVQLVIARRNNKIIEGTTVSINYVSGSSKKIQTMSLSKKAMNTGSNCIFVDDFMKGGGTAFGIIDLLKEFDSKILGIGVLVDNIEITEKLVDDYVSIVSFNGINEKGKAEIMPSKFFKQ